MDPIHPDITLEDLVAELAEPSSQLALTKEEIETQIHGMERMN